ncbi:glycosyltransferase family 4 protein [Vibrio sp. Scap16]|uniref:glycosyltransferase family 4 protein n=1 Tax=Vibrio sp. Scap16 TaxID=2589989 RepID=UPI00159D89FA|nr:glycosyltransferase [Vibrio sp. Scap16]NVN83446.1 glycosyltransferase [Vibrio sp. Scap16]
MSKNFVNLSESLCASGNDIIAITPTGFITHLPIEQFTFRKTSRYESLLEGGNNLIRLCKLLNRLLSEKKRAKVNIHIATPIELLLVFWFLDSRYRNNTTISIWQSYLSYQEFKDNYQFFIKNWTDYAHLLVFNSFMSSPIYARLLRFFHQVCVHNEYQKKQLIRCSNLPVTYIPIGVFSESFSKDTTQPHNEKLELLYIGHAKPSKGVDVLIDIVKKVRDRNYVDFQLTLCLSGFGDSDRIQRIVFEHELEQYVRFKKEIDIVKEMTSADLFILPLRTCVGTSLTPNLIIEAISCGLPIAVPEFEQLEEIIQFDCNAVKLDLHDLDSCAKTIESVVKENQLPYLSRYQTVQFEQNHTLEHFVTGYARALRLDGRSHG